MRIPLPPGWTVEQNRPGRVELAHQHTESKPRYAYQTYTQRIIWMGDTLSLSAAACGQTRKLAQVQGFGEEGQRALALLLANADPACWKPEDVVWLNQIWTEEQQRLGRKYVKLCPRPVEPYRTPQLHLVPLEIPAGWTAVWNTFDQDYLQPGFVSPAQGAALHWERDIASFACKGREPVCFLDLEDWSDEDLHTGAFRVHLYHWEEELVTLGEYRTRSAEEAREKMEEFFLGGYQNHG